MSQWNGFTKGWSSAQNKRRNDASEKPGPTHREEKKLRSVHVSGTMQANEHANYKYVGIDPGVKTGFAVWDSVDQAFISIETLDFWQVIDRLDTGLYLPCSIVIEDPGQNRPVFARKLKGESTQSFTSRMLKIGKNVGQNIREATLLADRLEWLGYDVTRKRPDKNSATKLSAEQFKKITGYTGRTNEHARDAAMLVYGRRKPLFK